jgi:hypothetical protein
MDTDPTWQPKFIDLSQVEDAFSFEEGFSRPDWRVISKAIKQQVAESFDMDAAWNEASRQWVMQLRSDLGGDYRVEESGRFILLIGLSDEGAGEKILAYAERTWDQIREQLQDAAWIPKHGKRVILLFSEDDDYYQYVSYYHEEGIHPTSGGCLIHRDYVHIAAPYEPFGIRAMLAHELVHNCVVHLTLPLWLNEGLATTFQRAAQARPRPILDHDLREQHLAFWNRESITLNLLLERRGNWSGFLKQAHRSDAGQTAAIEFLDVDLGAVMATFLGEGNWRPQRKVMAALWEAAKRSRPDSAA